MPIRPENKALYLGKKQWEQVRAQVLARATDSRGRQCCECDGECGKHDHECQAINHDAHPDTGAYVVLTVAHLDHDPRNNDLSNLRAMCQRCHNAYDAPNRLRNRRRNQVRKPGQGLFPFLEE